MMLLPDDIDAPPFTDDDLDEYFEWQDQQGVVHESGMISWVDEINPPKAAGWAVCDTGSAEWAMRRLAHAQHHVDAVNGDAERFIDQIERWREEQLRRPERAVSFFTGQLVTYARQKREEEGVKTLKLPSGQVPSRLNPARPDIPKEAKAEFIEWAKARELPVVKATWSPVMDEVKKHVLFRTVAFPNDGEHGEQVYVVGDDERDHLVVMPATVVADQIGALLEGLNMANLIGYTFHERPSTAIYRREDGSWWLVPGVVEVPAEVTYSVKPVLP